MDSDLLRVWQLVHELSNQLAQNQEIASALQSQAGSLKVCNCSASAILAEINSRHKQATLAQVLH